MGARARVKPRVVFDTNTIVSALLFRQGRLSALRARWQAACTPLASAQTVAELARVLNYGRFNLSPAELAEALALYLPYAEVVESVPASKLACRDPKDQPFLDLAEAGRADMLVSGDGDLLALKGHASCRILTPAEFLALP
ncbi:MAG: putative toxin-antitoxin system toxin component, PIN family [Gammaproteobacteria bacterium]|nr:putative toxin-antitoxin system toxin component, PIN family [Gammaproteobacteria bacterium]